MAINDISFSHGQLITAADLQAVSDDATNTTDDIHPQYNGGIILNDTGYFHYLFHTYGVIVGWYAKTDRYLEPSYTVNYPIEYDSFSPTNLVYKNIGKTFRKFKSKARISGQYAVVSTDNAANLAILKAYVKGNSYTIISSGRTQPQLDPLSFQSFSYEVDLSPIADTYIPITIRMTADSSGNNGVEFFVKDLFIEQVD